MVIARKGSGMPVGPHFVILADWASVSENIDQRSVPIKGRVKSPLNEAHGKTETTRRFGSGNDGIKAE